MTAKFLIHDLQLPAEVAGARFDQALAAALPQYSRARLQRWISAGSVLLDGRAVRPRERLAGGEQVRVQAEFPADATVEAEAISLQVVYEDDALLVIDKPAGLVVHPGAGNPRHTLQNALLAHDPALATVPRAGLIHRLDKETSGLLVVARTPQIHVQLVRMLQERRIARGYLALSLGRPTAGGTIAESIGRHRTQRTRMAVRRDGREAVTHYRIEERFRGHTLLRVQLETGRTHQIRVHLAERGHPLVGDPVYGTRAGRGLARLGPEGAAIAAFPRQALHAKRLGFIHPATGQALEFDSALPADLGALIRNLELL